MLPTVDNGNLIFSITRLGQSCETVSDSGLVAIFNFKSLNKAGNTDISFSNNSLSVIDEQGVLVFDSSGDWQSTNINIKEIPETPETPVSPETPETPETPVSPEPVHYVGGGGSAAVVRTQKISLLISKEEAEINEDGKSVLITWLTNKNSNSRVIYSKANEFHTLDLNDIDDNLPLYGYSSTTLEYDEGNYSQKTFHKIEIVDLLPETTYYYRCVSEDSSPVFSEEGHFIMPKIEQEVPEVDQDTVGEDSDTVEDADEIIETIEEDQEETENDIPDEIIVIEDISDKSDKGDELEEISEKEETIQSIISQEQKEEEEGSEEEQKFLFGFLASIGKFTPNVFILFILFIVFGVVLSTLFAIIFAKRKRKKQLELAIK